jgi:D-alanyl-D-alanine dipeptidase
VPETIDPRDLVPMDVFKGEPIEIDVVYAQAGHPENIFKTAIYKKTARLSLHADLARVTLSCARLLNERYGWTLVLKDGLRTIEAQQRQMETEIVRANPDWLEEPDVMLAKPGHGAHPRAMAIDVSLKDSSGSPVDMGTVFDEMTPQSARAYEGFSPLVLQNRQRLENGFMEAAEKLRLPMAPLSSEWWDFRFPRDYYMAFAPLSDNDLPASFQMCGHDSTPGPDEAALAKSVLMSL